MVMVIVRLVFYLVQFCSVQFMILNKLPCVKLAVAVAVAAAVRACLLNPDCRIPVSPPCYG